MTYSHYGDDSVLELTDQPTPKLGPGEVLIKVKAAAVNPVDWKIMSGALDALMVAVFPVIPGWDVAGVVEAIGIDTPEFSVGDEVYAYARKDFVHDGTFAEFINVPARSVAPKPLSMTFEQAAGVPLAGLTALQSLRRLGVGAGVTVLVHNASGGVGSAAVQIAKAWGATVITTASEKNHEYVVGLGADEVVSYGDGLVSAVKAVAPQGVDVVVDYVGGVLEQTVAVLKPGGKHASIADPNVLGAGGEWMWVRPSGADLGELAALADDGRLSVEVAETFPLEELPAAFARSREGHVRGKLIVTL